MESTALDNYRQHADPLADEAISRLVAEQGPAEAQALFELLIHRIETPIAELPECLHDYWLATDRLPDWVDWEQVRLANALFLDHGPKFLVFLYYKSLPLLYSCANGAKVLVQTGRLAHQNEKLEIFTRRIAETGQFLLAVMAPGALEPGGPGIRAIQKVRLIHGAIRFFVQEKGHWDREAWGLPINQEDMAITLATFSSALTDALGQFDIIEKPKSLEAYQYTWAAIGELLGVLPELAPKNTADSQTLMKQILEHQSAASQEGKILTGALLGFARETVPDGFDRFPELLLLHLIGTERAQLLGVLPRAGCLGLVLPEFIRAVFQLGERLEDRIKEPLRVFIDLFSQKLMEKMVQFFDRYKQRHFEVPAGLRTVWLPEEPEH